MSDFFHVFAQLVVDLAVLWIPLLAVVIITFTVALMMLPDEALEELLEDCGPVENDLNDDYFH